jgi:hypothetical protein
MWRFAKAFVTVISIFAMASSTVLPAEAGQPCRYWIVVSRQGFPGEGSARVCDVAEVVDWLRVVPEAGASAQVPQGALYDSFTVTVFFEPTFRWEPVPVPPPNTELLLTERVYPVAESGPVAFVPSRSIFHGTGRYPRWVVRAGWRSLDASKRVPPVLTKLGMLQPVAGPTTPTLAPTTATPTTGSSRPGPDLVTLLFLVAILVFVGAAVRRNIGRTRPIRDGLGHHSNPSHHG